MICKTNDEIRRFLIVVISIAFILNANLFVCQVFADSTDPLDVSFNLEQTEANVGDTVSVSYSISGGSGVYSVSYAWYMATDDSLLGSTYSTKYQISNSNTGTATYTIAAIDRFTYLAVVVTDSEGRKKNFYSPQITVATPSQVEPLNVEFTLNKTEAQVGDTVSASFVISGGSGSYSASYAWYMATDDSLLGSTYSTKYQITNSNTGTATYTIAAIDRFTYLAVMVTDSEGRKKNFYSDSIRVMASENRYEEENPSSNGSIPDENRYEEENPSSNGSIPDVVNSYSSSFSGYLGDRVIKEYSSKSYINITPLSSDSSVVEVSFYGTGMGVGASGAYYTNQILYQCKKEGTTTVYLYNNNVLIGTVEVTVLPSENNTIIPTPEPSDNSQLPTDLIQSEEGQFEQKPLIENEDENEKPIINPVPERKGTELTDEKTKSIIIVTNSSKSNPTVEYKEFDSYNTKVTIPETVTVDDITYTVTSIGKEAFMDNFFVKKITVPDTVTKIGTRAFKECLYLKEIVIGSGVKSIGKYAFKGCEKLKSITIESEYLTEDSIKKMLSGSSVKTIKVPENKIEYYKTIFTKKNCGKKVKVIAK